MSRRLLLNRVTNAAGKPNGGSDLPDKAGIAQFENEMKFIGLMGLYCECCLPSVLSSIVAKQTEVRETSKQTMQNPSR